MRRLYRQAGRQNGTSDVQTTVNRRRPRARRRFSTARPPRLDIRLRNPCSRLRGIRFGWYVRFGIKSLNTSRDTQARWTKNAGQVGLSIRQRRANLALPAIRSVRRPQWRDEPFQAFQSSWSPSCVITTRSAPRPDRQRATRLRTAHTFLSIQSRVRRGSRPARRTRHHLPIALHCRDQRCRRPAP